MSKFDGAIIGGGIFFVWIVFVIIMFAIDSKDKIDCVKEAVKNSSYTASDVKLLCE